MKKLLITLASVFLFGTAQAQALFTRTVTIVTNASVGSGPDVLLRSITPQLEKIWSVPVVIENKPGGSGVVALEYYLKEQPNDHMLYYGDVSNFVNMPILFHKEALVERVKPLTPVYTSAFIVIAPPGKSDLKEFEKSIKKTPFYGSWGVGSLAHLCGAEIADRYKVDATHAPYKDYSNWLTDVMTGTLSYSCSTIGSTQGFEKAGKLSYVAVTGPTRNPAYPNVPTVKEAFGIELSQPIGFSGMYISRATPDARADQITQGIKTAIKTDIVQTTIKNLYGDNWNPTTKEFNQHQQQETIRVKRAIEKYKISVD